MIQYRATLDVPRELALHLARLLRAEQRKRGTRKGRRALTAFRQAVLVLRWFRDRTPVARLAHDNAIGISTAYRYLHEGIDVLADQAPELPDVLRARAGHDLHVILDGILIRSDRVADRTDQGRHLWYSGKHRAFGGNVQFVSTATGFPLWVSDVEPGSTHDRNAATLTGATAALCAAAATTGLVILADKAYQSAGIGIRIPFRNRRKGQRLAPDNLSHNILHTRLRCLGERAAALLTTRWKTLTRITLCPQRIGDIAKAALVLTQFEHAGRY